MNDYSNVAGFNYRPSYAYNSYDEWRFFDKDIIDREIGLEKIFSKDEYDTHMAFL